MPPAAPALGQGGMTGGPARRGAAGQAPGRLGARERRNLRRHPAKKLFCPDILTVS